MTRIPARDLKSGMKVFSESTQFSFAIKSVHVYDDWVDVYGVMDQDWFCWPADKLIILEEEAS